jgi:exonuclease SbcD
MGLRLLHTSDWHLGHRFHGRQRHDEQGSFLDWLIDQIETCGVDVLLVAGDVFDTTTPGNRAQSLYYRFLNRLAGSCCRHVVITGGNHDSPALLEAPRELLRQLDIHVVGSIDSQPDKEVVLLRDRDGQPELVVCAVPFLRDRDIRTAAPGETLEEKGRQLRDGIREHYRQVCDVAERLREEVGGHLPLVAMGHLFVAGGRTVEGDGVRELTIGGLDRIDGASFPASIDYLALGHLHLGQLVAGNPTRRYCGAPLPMSFSEAGLRKEVLLLTWEQRGFVAEPIAVPVLQPIASLSGDLSQLLKGLEELKTDSRSFWVELQYIGDILIPNLREQLLAAVEESNLTLLRIRNNRLYDYTLQQDRETESLDELSVTEVFERCLAAHQVEEGQRHVLGAAFTEITTALDQADNEV